MPKLRSLPSLVRPVDTRTVTLPPKVKADIYNTPEFQHWRARVIARAGGRCEAMVQGHRGGKGRPEHKVYADHVVEIKDKGSMFDINNGQCLCASHHTTKTMQARYRRHSTRIDGG